LLKISDKNDWHRGQYKQHSNAVQATFPDGSIQIIFKTTEPGFATDEEMKNLVNWIRKKDDINPIIKTAAYVYEFLSIHPFQDGNVRLSRLLTTLLLLQKDYEWVEYISFEHEIEKRKKKYYQALRNCQAKRPNEDITEWVEFFLDSLKNLIKKLNKKLGISESDLSSKQKNVYVYICNNPESKISQIREGTEVPRATLKRVIKVLLDKDMIEKMAREQELIIG